MHVAAFSFLHVCPQVWSLTSQQETFRAKGAKPNRVGNVDLPFLTAVACLPGTDSQVVLVGTAKVRMGAWDCMGAWGRMGLYRPA